MRLTRCLIGIVLIAGCQRDTEPETPNPPPEEPGLPQTELTQHLTPDGWQALRIGMTRDEVVAALGEDANPNAVGGADPAQCDQFRPSRAPEGLLVMMEQGRLTRITVSAPATLETEGGLSVGDAATDVVAYFGSRATSTPHKYSDAPAGYITVWSTGNPPSPEARGIVYEVGTDGRVEHIHAGGPSIQYVEGCS